MNTTYQHHSVEKKWQKSWLKNKTFKAELDQSKPKYYVLDMFPYPSGTGLHVGHVAGYTATDILARYKRQRGFNVLHPMGWDSFGLPAEQYAIRTGTHPAKTTSSNVKNFRSQLQALGFSYDWDRELATSDPKYYRWTQWIFTKLYEKGLAYEAEMLVNYCPELGTVLANEEVENGLSKEGGHLVERRPLKQWVLKITEYADRLIKDLDLLDWPSGLKKLQVNWIGRSEGANITFTEEKSGESLTVYTTRHDTLFGATYLVVSPEHPILQDIVTDEQRSAVDAYVKKAANKSDMDRTELNKEKTGVFTGAYAINPVNQEQIPIWTADYVLMGYGTGAIMAVPAHDERDFEFAQVYNLPVRTVFNAKESVAEKHFPNEKPEEVCRNVLEGKKLWVHEGEYINSTNDELSLHGLSVKEAKACVAKHLESTKTGERAINYKLRDWLFSRQRYWGEPFPILHFEDGSHRVLNEDELPLLLPEISDYKPSGSGESPLANCKEWVEIIDPVTGKKALRETNTMPNWAGSCWYYLRFCDPHNDMEAWDKDKEAYWGPVDMYIGGVEHAVLHLLYARFWHKVLYDCGLVKHPEPFTTLRNQGLITARSYQDSTGAYVEAEEAEKKGKLYFNKKTGEQLKSQVEKMSKSKLNGVNPDIIIDEFGADSLRLYEMFMGPLEKEKPWSTDAVHGCYRFLNRFYDMAVSDKLCDEDTKEGLKLSNQLLQGAMSDIDGLQFNNVVAKMMEFVNAFSKLDRYPKKALAMATQILSWYAPHAAEEIWEILGFEGSIVHSQLPQVDESYLQEDSATYIIQVNGKLRGRFNLAKGQDKEQVLELAHQDSHISRFISGEIKKVIFVPNKLLNIVV